MIWIFKREIIGASRTAHVRISYTDIIITADFMGVKCVSIFHPTPLPDSKGSTDEVCSNFIQHFSGYEITYPCSD